MYAIFHLPQLVKVKLGKQLVKLRFKMAQILKFYTINYLLFIKVFFLLLFLSIFLLKIYHTMNKCLAHYRIPHERRERKNANVLLGYSMTIQVQIFRGFF